MPAFRRRDRSHCGDAIAPAAATAPDGTTFAPGLRLLPPDLRADAYRLYNLLRKLDDLVDEDQPDASERVLAVEEWVQGKLITTPETQQLTDLSQRHRMPAGAILDFCRAMRHDIARETIHTEDDLERYCQRAGGSVGIMIARILGVTGEAGEAKMATLGRAMQRTNIARDIDEDATHGRLYIAQATIERFGPPVPGARTNLLRNQISRADSLYDQAADAVTLLPRGKRAMALSIALYREILRQIEREGYGQRPGRVVVPTWRRNLLIIKHRLPVISA